MIGDKNIGLQAAPGATDLYQRFGFKLSSFYIDEYRFIPEKKQILPLDRLSKHILIKEMLTEHFQHGVEYDAKICCLARPDVFQMWMDTCPFKFIAFKNGDVCGYVFARKGINYRVSPLFADNKDIALSLLHSLLNAMDDDERIEVSIPVENEDALAMFADLGMTKEHFVERSIRLNTHHNLPLKLENTYCFTNYEPLLL